ncbi:hypothetical protein G5I_03664 [Acromyrmex echinatior]|uniref:Uncharacterized protein n=1 Tax=Acromyrmex echinatior TaxID=103372 RepID=F4WDL0_ACREC|nr:hypothetical protein G5I_03664 [Acromyrmex echinatior]
MPVAHDEKEFRGAGNGQHAVLKPSCRQGKKQASRQVGKQAGRENWQTGNGVVVDGGGRGHSATDKQPLLHARDYAGVDRSRGPAQSSLAKSARVILCHSPFSPIFRKYPNSGQPNLTPNSDYPNLTLEILGLWYATSHNIAEPLLKRLVRFSIATTKAIKAVAKSPSLDDRFFIKDPPAAVRFDPEQPSAMLCHRQDVRVRETDRPNCAADPNPRFGRYVSPALHASPFPLTPSFLFSLALIRCA